MNFIDKIQEKDKNLALIFTLILRLIKQLL
jgi:hypothetical protein